MTASAYESLCAHARETALLRSTAELLQWDEETYLPPAGGEYRAEQLAYLARLVHQRQTDPRVGGWLDELAGSDLAADPHSETGATIHHLRRDFDKQTKLPESLVAELTRTSSLGQQAWREARGKDDFSIFKPLFEKTIELKKQEAEAIGYEDSPYDALLDDYEPGETAANVTRVLAGLRAELTPLVEEIVASGRRPGPILSRDYPVDRQEAIGRRAAEAIGFDFTAGRLDVTAHPFCGGGGPRDIRLTTRYQLNDLADSLFSTLHEAGHGIYEQGLPPEHFGLPTGESVSLGIHESQSRMWENLVGRSRGFWRWLFGPMVELFPAALKEVSVDDFYFAVNESRPSLIRTESDEATYNLHIIVRFELEQALLAGDLAVADAPAAWNAKYREYLGVEPPSDSDGVLQDVHWSAGLIGYFPTYTLGNLYAAQFFDAAEAELGGLDAMFARGDFRPLLDWLRKHIHRHGRRYSAGELVERVTGLPLSHEPLMRRLRAKFGELYGLA